MKHITNLLFGFLLLTNLSLTIADLNFGSFQPKETFLVSGKADGDNFGYSVSTAGDINNDGYNDTIVGAYGNDNYRGAVYVIYGGDKSSLTDIPLTTQTLDPATTGFIITGNAGGDWLGYSVSTAGDIDNDGYDDIIIGAHQKNTNQGAVYVVYGGATSAMTNIALSTQTLFPQSTGFMITGNAVDDNFGYSVSTAGDINKDGYDDIIVGAYYKGVAYVIYGGPRSTRSDIFLSSALIPTSTGFMITGSASDQFGYSVSTAGDINNDGYDDIIVGANYRLSKQGAVYVVYGGDKSAMTNIVLSSTQTLDPLSTGFMISGPSDSNFGCSVSSAGDINNDEYDDIIIGANYYKGNWRGAAYVIYGGAKSAMPNRALNTQTLDPLNTGFTITGNAQTDRLGSSVSSAGDINNDGYADIIIGAWSKTGSQGTNQGAAYVIYGGEKSAMSDWDFSSSTTTLDPLKTGLMITGDAASDQFGFSVSRAGDINKDGFDDLIIGANGKSSFKGASYLILGPFKCPEGCSDCNSASSCLTCSEGYLIDNSNCSPCPAGCIKCSTLSTCDICSTTKYILEGSNCSPCPTNCETCSSSSSCDTCTTPYLLYHAKCDYDTCPSTTFTSDSVKCEDCPSGCAVCSSTSVCKTCLDGYTLTKQKSCQLKVTETKFEEKTGEKAAAGAFEGTSLVGASLASGSSLPLNFGLVAKLIRNFKYMALPVSRELQETFISWKVASGFMSAPDSWSEKYSSKTIPMVFSRYGLQSAFLINFWKPLSMALIGIAVFAVFKAIEILISKGNEKKTTLSTISRQVNVAASNFALTQFYSNLDDVVFYFILEMRSTEFETGFRVCSTLLAIVLLVAGGVLIGGHLKLVAKYQNLKERGSVAQLKSFEAKCENINLIFKDFKDANILVQSFLMINVGRSILSSLIFATLFEYPMIQISFLFVLNILMLVYLSNKKSFKELASTGGQIFCELILFIANICVFLLALFDHAESYPLSSIENLGKCIIVLNYILLFGCAILLLFSIGKILYQAYQGRNNSAKVSQAPPEKFKNPKGLPGLTESDHISTNSGFLNESQNNSHYSDSFTNNSPMKMKSYNNHVSPDENSSNIGYQSRIPSKFIHESQNNSDSLTDNSSMKIISNENHVDIERHPSNMRPQQDYSIQNRPRNEVPSSNNAVQGGQIVEDFGEQTSNYNMLPRSRLIRNREITKARIARLTSSPERRIQDPSFD